MALPWIVQGDKTTHGGMVLEGDPTFTTHGKPVAHVGHMTSCPKCKGGPFPIATGAPDFVNNGRPVARHGDRTACGASLISGQFVSAWGSESSAGRRSSSPEAGAAPVRLDSDTSGYDEHFVLIDEGSGKPIAGFAYAMEFPSGEHEGQTGQDGKTAYAVTDSPQPVKLKYAVQLEPGVRE
jgi:uncharacterized Zn-binding protein involved in type VI secretion